MIPKDIQREHIISAIEYVDLHGLPSRRQSKKLNLFYKGKNYPPKYIVGLANKFRDGQELDPKYFSSGNETINFLRKRNFTVIDLTDKNR